MKTLPSVNTDWTPMRMIDRPQRPHLVILRTGKNSLHTTWPKDLDGADRSWDLMLSHYADSDPACPDAEMIVRQQAFKFSAMHRLFKDIDWLKQYRAVWLCDDDIMTSWATINRMFALFEQYALLLAQPALTLDSYFARHITLQQADYLMRFTNYAEVMAPVFSAHALQICLPTFENAITAWGIDWAWPALLGNPWNKVAVIDATPVFHTRPIQQGDIYKNAADQEGIAPMQEHFMNLEKYGVEAHPLAYGSINSEPLAFGEKKLMNRADMQQMDRVTVALGRPETTKYSNASAYRAELADWHSGKDAAAVSCDILPLQAEDYVLQFGLRLNLESVTADAVEILLIGGQRKGARALIDAGALLSPCR